MLADDHQLVRAGFRAAIGDRQRAGPGEVCRRHRIGFGRTVSGGRSLAR